MEKSWAVLNTHWTLVILTYFDTSQLVYTIFFQSGLPVKGAALDKIS